VRLLLDTAVLIYAVESPEQLSQRASAALQNPENVLELSAISLAEIAIKASFGKLKLSPEMARHAVEDLQTRILPFTAEHAYALFDLPLHHRDPFDRQILAQAVSEDVPVVTPDKKFELYRGIKVVW
jgi:PIN domain nuclease of toxin-antitoxin system